MQAVCAKCSRLMCRAVVLFLVAECAQTTPMIAPLPGDPNFSIDGSVAFFKSGESNPTQPNPPPPTQAQERTEANRRNGGPEPPPKRPLHPGCGGTTAEAGAHTPCLLLADSGLAMPRTAQTERPYQRLARGRRGREPPRFLWGPKIPKPATVRNTTIFVKLYHKGIYSGVRPPPTLQIGNFQAPRSTMQA